MALGVLVISFQQGNRDNPDLLRFIRMSPILFVVCLVATILGVSRSAMPWPETIYFFRGSVVTVLLARGSGVLDSRQALWGLGGGLQMRPEVILGRIGPSEYVGARDQRGRRAREILCGTSSNWGPSAERWSEARFCGEAEPFSSGKIRSPPSIGAVEIPLAQGFVTLTRDPVRKRKPLDL